MMLDRCGWRVVVAGMFAMLAGLSSGGPVLGWEFFYTDGGDPLHWNVGEVPFLVDYTGIPEIESDGENLAIEDAFAAWSELSDCFQLVYAGLTMTPEMAFHQDATLDQNHVVFVTNGWTSVADNANKTAVAFTRLKYETKTGTLVDVDIAVNLEQYDFSLCGEPEGVDAETVDFLYVMLHESGHVTGLDHSTNPFAVVHVQDSRCVDFPPRQLAPDDKEGFLDYYGGLDCTEGEELVEPPPIVEAADDASPDGGSVDGDVCEENCQGDRAPDCGCVVSRASTAGSPALGFLVFSIAVFLALRMRRLRRG